MTLKTKSCSRVLVFRVFLEHFYNILYIYSEVFYVVYQGVKRFIFCSLSMKGIPCFIFILFHCQAQPKSKFSSAEIARKLDSNLHNNRGSIIQAEYEPQELFKGSWPKL